MSEALFDIGGDPLEEIVRALHRYPAWPRGDDVKDRRFAAELLDEFSGVDVLAEIAAWRVWMMDHEQKKEVRPRARVHRWLRGARGDLGRAAGAASARSRRTSTAARPRDAFGTESSRDFSRW